MVEGAIFIGICWCFWIARKLSQIHDVLSVLNFRLAQKEMEDAFKRGNEKIQKR